ncbi:MAG: large conductance mechanosensitive channel protein MscL [Clostridia bacterium]|nr:large conductance mechanosensitive channel protein MscL [Clostridia bacterium]MBO6244559.1 large conductance mechanosensitive channel protein MscL [Clostridia bacterium]
MFKEFKEFISKGNVMDLAIGVIIGGAFSDIVSALTSSFIQPLLNLIGGAEVKGTIPLGDSGQALNYGAFLTAVINFLIVAFVLFMIVKAVNTANKKSKERLEKLATKVSKKGKKGSEEEEEKEPETKLCRYCLTEISYKATRCPHCTSILEEEAKKAIESIKE